MKTLQEIFKALPEDRQAKIQARTAELVAQEMTLRQLRKKRHLTQEQLSAWLCIGQDNVSRLENRSDMRLSTLRSYIAALGGTLELIVRLPDHPPIVLSGLGEDGKEYDVTSYHPVATEPSPGTDLSRFRDRARQTWSLLLNQIRAIGELFTPPPTLALAGVRRGHVMTPRDEESVLSAIDPSLLGSSLLPLDCKPIPKRPNHYALLLQTRELPRPATAPQVRLWIGETPVTVEPDYDPQDGRLNLEWSWETPLKIEGIELMEAEDGSWGARLVIESP